MDVVQPQITKAIFVMQSVGNETRMSLPPEREGSLWEVGLIGTCVRSGETIESCCYSPRPPHSCTTALSVLCCSHCAQPELGEVGYPLDSLTSLIQTATALHPYL